MLNTMKIVIILFFINYNLIASGMASQTPVKDAIDLELNKLKAVFPPVGDPLGLNLALNVNTNQTNCTCGVFLSGQLVRGPKSQPIENAVLLHEQDVLVPCTPMGQKTCMNKCLETIAKHLPNSPSIICGSIDRDVFRERAYLFTKDCNGVWINSNFSAGREFCCKDGASYKCPMKTV